MTHPLRQITQIAEPPADYLHRVGRVFAVFGEKSQDSGNVSFSVELAGERFFVKTAGDPADTRWFLTHAQRVALLHNAVDLWQSSNHPALPILYNVIESPYGPMLVYQWLAGKLLRETAPVPGTPSAAARFRALPAARIGAGLHTVFELHAQLADAGWVAEDFYDGCLLYDFSEHRMRIIDLDTYHCGPFINDRGRLFGSTRFMAPEEFERGATIDQRTTVFAMGRLAALYSSLACDATEVIRRATDPDPAARFATVHEFLQAWRNVHPTTAPAD